MGVVCLPLVVVRAGARVLSILRQPAHVRRPAALLSHDGPNNVAQRHGRYAQRNYNHHSHQLMKARGPWSCLVLIGLIVDWLCHSVYDLDQPTRPETVWVFEATSAIGNS